MPLGLISRYSGALWLAAQVIDVRIFESDAHQLEAGKNFATIDSDWIVIELHDNSPCRRQAVAVFSRCIPNVTLPRGISSYQLLKGVGVLKSLERLSFGPVVLFHMQKVGNKYKKPHADFSEWCLLSVGG